MSDRVKQSEKDSKHTEEFKRIMSKGSNQYDGEPTHAQANGFVTRLSEELSEDIVNKIATETGKKYVTNIQIYKYCKKHGIEADYDPYLNEQKEFDFSKKKIDYATLKSMDDIEIDGKSGFVLANDTEKKILTVEFDDDTIETVNYGEK